MLKYTCNLFCTHSESFNTLLTKLKSLKMILRASERQGMKQFSLFIWELLIIGLRLLHIRLKKIQIGLISTYLTLQICSISINQMNKYLIQWKIELEKEQQ